MEDFRLTLEFEFVNDLDKSWITRCDATHAVVQINRARFEAHTPKEQEYILQHEAMHMGCLVVGNYLRGL